MSPFRRVLVAYDGADMLHERLLMLDAGPGAQYIILTPDDDFYQEDFDNDVVEIRVLGDDGELPFGVGGRNLYRFGAPLPTNAELSGMLTEAAGLVTGRGHQPRRFVPHAGAVPRDEGGLYAAPPVVGGGGGRAVAAAAAEVWVLAEPLDHHTVGDELAAPPAATVVGDRAVVLIGGVARLIQRIPRDDVATYKDDRADEFAHLVRDARVLPVRYDNGVRYREFRDAVRDSVVMGSLEGFPSGPRTALPLFTELVRRGRTPQTYPKEWVAECNIPKGDRSVFELTNIFEMFQAFACIDQFNLGNSVGIEIGMRRAQVIFEAHSVSPSNPDYSASDVIMGLGRRAGSGLFDDRLAAHTAARLRDDAAILKEKRKAGEEKRLKPDKGDKK